MSDPLQPWATVPYTRRELVWLDHARDRAVQETNATGVAWGVEAVPGRGGWNFYPKKLADCNPQLVVFTASELARPERFRNTREALRVWDAEQPELDRQLVSIKDGIDFAEWQAAEHHARERLAQAFYADTKDLNTLTNCRLVDPETLRRWVAQETEGRPERRLKEPADKSRWLREVLGDPEPQGGV